jgi:hypothetical protein
VPYVKRNLLSAFNNIKGITMVYYSLLELERYTPEIKNIFSKLTAEINTKITNELSARLSEVNSSFTAELGKNNNKLTAKLIYMMPTTPLRRRESSQ